MQYEYYTFDQRKLHRQQSIEDDGECNRRYRQQGTMPVFEDVIVVSQGDQALDYASCYKIDGCEEHLPTDCG